MFSPSDVSLISTTELLFCCNSWIGTVQNKGRSHHSIQSATDFLHDDTPESKDPASPCFQAYWEIKLTASRRMQNPLPTPGPCQQPRRDLLYSPVLIRSKLMENYNEAKTLTRWAFGYSCRAAGSLPWERRQGDETLWLSKSIHNLGSMYFPVFPKNMEDLL